MKGTVRCILVLGIALLTFSSCRAISSLLHDDEVVAEVGRHYLYRSEVASLIPDGTSEEDSLRLAQTISEEGLKKGIVVPVLIEVNVAGEETKFGVKPEEAEGLIREIAGLPSISVKGLMTIAPYVENPEDNRGYFACLRKLCVDIKNKNIDNVSMNVLSMGMTGDYEVAIEEGATMVRVGTGIFGERDYNI